MTDIEVHIELDGETLPVGLARRHAARGAETITSEYAEAWLANDRSFSIDPGLRLGRGVFPPAQRQAIFGALGDSAPDTWGRRLMQRAERRRAEREGRGVQTLSEADYLLGVSDETRLGALRFRWAGETVFQAPARTGVPSLVELGRLMAVTERILRDEETEEDLQFIFAPGSSLGGARPKASVVDQHGTLFIAKFPRETDDYSVETWEAVALGLARRAGIETPDHRLADVAGKKVLLSKRFDRAASGRLPFLSAMSMLQAADGDHRSYPELVDVLTEFGAQPRRDVEELYRRMAFNVLISNVDDHLRNHGFLWVGQAGWALSPAYDLNPTPTDIRPRILSTNIDLDDGTCSLALVEAAAEFFGLAPPDARAILRSVADAVQTWRDVAAAAGARPNEIKRMASAFEHADLVAALEL